MKTLAVIFPGQGSQSVGMLNVYADHPVVRTTIDEASDALGENFDAGPRFAHVRSAH